MWGCCAVISKKISNGSFCAQFQIHLVVLCHPYDVMRKHIFQSHQDHWKRLVLAWSDDFIAVKCSWHKGRNQPL